MKKKKYIQPTTETLSVESPRLMAGSEGWSQNQGGVTPVDQEGGWGNQYTDSIGGWGGFLDLD